MKRFPKILAATCAAIALSSSLALAAEPAPATPAHGAHGAHQAGPMGPMGAMGLAALTPEKQAAAFKLLDERRAALFPLHQSIYAKRAELEALNASGAGVTDKTRAAIREIADIEGKMLAVEADFRAKLFKETGLRTLGMGHGMMDGGMQCGMMGGMKDGMMGGMMGGMKGAPMGAKMDGMAPAAAPAEHSAHQ